MLFLLPNFLPSNTQALASLAGPWADGTGDFRGFTPAALLESIMDQTQQVTRQCNRVAERFLETWDFVCRRSKGQGSVCWGRVWSVKWRQRQCQAGTDRSFPIHAGGRRYGLSSPGFDSSIYGCTRSLPSWGHSFSSASRRASAAESAQHRWKCHHVACAILWYFIPHCGTKDMASVSWKPTSPFLPLFPLTEKKCFVNAQLSLSGSLYAGTLNIVYSLRTQCHTLPHSNHSAKHTVFLWLKCFFEILPTKKQQMSIFAPPD